jgi:hypothetical protein
MSSFCLVSWACESNAVDLGGAARPGHAGFPVMQALEPASVDGGPGVPLSSPAHAGPANASDGWIVFDSDRDQFVQHLYAVRADGSGLTALTSGPAPDLQPVVSFDGKTIAFASGRAGTQQIYSLDVASHEVWQLTSLSNGASEPAFSPDAKLIAFHSGTDVYVMNSDGTSVRDAIPVTSTSGTFRFEHPVFTPQGDGIVVDGTNLIEVHDLSGNFVYSFVGGATFRVDSPAISRDGSNIAFITDMCWFNHDSGETFPQGDFIPFEDINAAPFTGCARVMPTAGFGSLSHPSWGPHMLMTFTHVSTTGLYRVAVTDGANAKAHPADLLPGDGSNQQDPTWAPSTFSPPGP